MKDTVPDDKDFKRLVRLVIMLVCAGAALMVVSVTLSYVPLFQELLFWLTTQTP